MSYGSSATTPTTPTVSAPVPISPTCPRPVTAQVCARGCAGPGSRARARASSESSARSTTRPGTPMPIGDALRAYANGRKDGRAGRTPFAELAINGAASTLGRGADMTPRVVDCGALPRPDPGLSPPQGDGAARDSEMPGRCARRMRAIGATAWAARKARLDSDGPGRCGGRPRAAPTKARLVPPSPAAAAVPSAGPAGRPVRGHESCPTRRWCQWADRRVLTEPVPLA